MTCFLKTTRARYHVLANVNANEARCLCLVTDEAAENPEVSHLPREVSDRIAHFLTGRSQRRDRGTRPQYFARSRGQ